MTKIHKVLCVLAVAIVSATAAVAILRACWQRPEPTQRVDAQLQINSPDFMTFIQNRVASITYKQPDGLIGTYDIPLENPTVTRLTLTSEKTLRLPDDHGFTDLALVSVTNNKATISYLSTINVTSFGDNKTSVQTGTVTIGVLKNDH